MDHHHPHGKIRLMFKQPYLLVNFNNKFTLLRGPTYIADEESLKKRLKFFMVHPAGTSNSSLISCNMPVKPAESFEGNSTIVCLPVPGEEYKSNWCVVRAALIKSLFLQCSAYQGDLIKEFEELHPSSYFFETIQK